MKYLFGFIGVVAVVCSQVVTGIVIDSLRADQKNLLADVRDVERKLFEEMRHEELDEVWEAIQKVENGLTFNRYFHDRLRERVDRLQMPMAEPNLQENPLLPSVGWKETPEGQTPDARHEATAYGR